MTRNPNLFDALALLAFLATAPADVRAGEGGRGVAVGPGVAALVNGVPIRAERFERYFEDFLAEKGRSVAAIRSPTAYNALQREALDKLVDTELLWQEAKRRKVLASQAEVDAALAEVKAGFKAPAAFERRLERGGFTAASYVEYLRQQLSIRKLVQQRVVSRLSVRDAEVRAHYDANPERFTRPEEVHVRHLLVKVAPTASADELGKARAKIDALLARARGGEPFAALAREHSEDSTAAAGGDLGFIGRGQMVRPFEDAAFALQPGQVSGVVQTVFGLHLVAAEERRGGGRIPFTEAAPGIRERLLAEKGKDGLEREVRSLRERGEVVLARSY